MAKKILLLNYEFPPLGGGAANATKYLLREFSKYKDLEITFVTSSINEFKIEKFSNNIEIHYLDIGKKGKNLHFQSNRELLSYTLKANKYAQKLKKKIDFDLVHAFFGIPCGHIAKKLNLPYIVSLRGSDVPFYNSRFKYYDKFFFKGLSKKVWKGAEFVVANSKYLKDLALQSCPEQDIKIIYNGVNLEEFKRNGNDLENSLSKKFEILSVGRLIERKGLKYLLEALKDVKNVSLTIVGDGPLKENLISLAKDYNIDAKFLGDINHDEIPKYYKKADIFVLPSLSESMSNTILEAIAASLPIITTKTGPQEIIKGNGFIVNIESPKEIKDAIIELRDNPLLKKNMGKRSFEIAKDLSWEKIALEYYKLYVECFKKNDK
ncbi:MAG: glycosyltransferase family 4 protein [Nanoarchaeota archaeon]|nr:glycosyltransferase family 4 protein [Nanoarchaeota archaeon]